METESASKLKELQAALKGADDEFAANLHVTARSLLLYRIAGSSDKKAEVEFLSTTFMKILGESGGRMELKQIVPNLSQDVERKSVGQLFSETTDLLDTLTTGEIYKLLSLLRNEPIHLKLPFDFESAPSVGHGQLNESRLVPSAQGVGESPTSYEYDVDARKPQSFGTKGQTHESSGQPPPQNFQEAPREKLPEIGSRPVTESDREVGLQKLVDELHAGNARIDELTSDLVATKQRLESFEKNHGQSDQRIEVLRKELSKVPRRLDEIEDNLTSIVNDSL